MNTLTGGLWLIVMSFLSLQYCATLQASIAGLKLLVSLKYESHFGKLNNDPSPCPLKVSMNENRVPNYDLNF